MKTRLSRIILCVLLCSTVLPALAAAQRRGGGGGDQGTAVPRPPVVHRGEVFIGGFFYDPVWGPYPWWPRPIYPYPYFPVYDVRASVRVIATPREAAVYVDGFFAGYVDDFDGAFQRLHVPPGGHKIVLYLEGFRTERHSLYLGPGSSMTLRATLERLPRGELSERPASAPPVPPPPPGTFRQPRRPAPLPPPDVVRATPIEASGTLDLHVQPSGAHVAIDDQVWASADPRHFVIELAAGRHQLKISLPGYDTYAAEIVIRDDEVTTLNVSLTKSRARAGARERPRRFRAS